MVLTDKSLSSGRKVKIKQLTIDEMDECRDTQKIIFKDDATILTDTNKARTKWIRKGLAGGEFKNFKSDNNEPVDGVLKQLDNAEMDELVKIIQEVNTLGEALPSSTV